MLRVIAAEYWCLPKLGELLYMLLHGFTCAHTLEILAHVVTLPLGPAAVRTTERGCMCINVMLPHVMENCLVATVPLDVPLWVITSNRFITLQIDSCKSEHNEIKIMCVLVQYRLQSRAQYCFVLAAILHNYRNSTIGIHNIRYLFEPPV